MTGQGDTAGLRRPVLVAVLAVLAGACGRIGVEPIGFDGPPIDPLDSGGAAGFVGTGGNSGGFVGVDAGLGGVIQSVGGAGGLAGAERDSGGAAGDARMAGGAAGVGGSQLLGGSSGGPPEAGAAGEPAAAGAQSGGPGGAGAGGAGGELAVAGFAGELTLAGAAGAAGRSYGGASGGGRSGGGGQAGSPVTLPTPLGVIETTGQSVEVGNPTGGDPYTDLCPTGELLVGFSGYLSTSGWLAQIQAHCAVLGVSGNDPYAVTVVSTSTTPLRGEQGDPAQPWTSVCPDGAAVVGFEGAFGSFIDSLVFYCAPLVVVGTAGGPAIALDPAQALPAAGGPGGDPFPRVDCPTGEVARGVDLRTGFYLDLIQLVCGSVSAP